MPVNSPALVEIANIVPTASATAAVTTVPVRIDDRGRGDQRLGAGKRVRLSILRGRKGAAGTMADTLGTLAVYGVNLPNPLSAVPLGNAFAASVVPTSQVFAGDGSTTRFQTNIPFVAFDNYNWIVETASRTLAGTFTVTAGVIAGSSTTLNTAGVNVEIGDKLMIGGQLCVVTSVTSDTVASVSPAITVTAGATGYQLSQRDRIKTYNDTEVLSTEYAVDDVGGYACIDFGIAPPSEKVNSIAINGGFGAQGPGIAVYYVTPTEILASGMHADERVGVMGRTCMWTVYDGDANDDFDAARITVEAVGE
jgi:hypothetical protein